MTFNYNKAIEFLLARGNLPILFWLKKDILGVPVDREHKNLQKFAARIRILEAQKPNGGWCKKKYEGHPRWEKTYYIVDTLRNIFRLHNYGCTLEDKGVQLAVKFLFSTQTEEGDFRGAFLNEYAPTYHSLTLEILCRHGLDKDRRVQKGFRWIVNNRQNDGGWVIPCQTIKKEELKARYNPEAQLTLDPVMPDKEKPFSHLVTGMVLRAFAVSEKWSNSKEAQDAGELLLARFFKEDEYDYRRQSSHWEELSYPFFATDILSSLDALSKVGFSSEDESIQNSLVWLDKKQNSQGFWEASSAKATLEDHLWVTLAVLRVLKKFGMIEL